MSGPRDGERETAAETVTPTSANLARAATILEAGGLVAVPTETVYGLAADATNGRAVAGIYAAKGRPSFNPLICHVSDLEMAESIAVFTPLARRLADAFWPGPLTLVLPKSATCPVSELATAGLSTIAVRMPKHPATTEIIARLRRPIAAPSANPSEQLSPTSAAHVAAALGLRIDLIVDGGVCPAGIESSIVAVMEDGCTLLRPGALARADIEAITGPLKAPDPESGVVAPGMMRRHYAPSARLRTNATSVGSGEAFLGFGAPPAGVEAAMNLSARGDLAEAAANLFSMLRLLDETVGAIAVAPIPETGLGEGINDRLARASASPPKVRV